MRMETGYLVMHLFCTAAPDLDRDALDAAIDAANADGCQVVTSSILGHKADAAFMVLGADTTAIRRFQTAIQRAGVVVVDSYVSITEVNEYAKGLPERMIQDRLYPQLPPEGKQVFCFYPMSKRREAHANWYAAPYDERFEMMMEHGTSGRAFAGQVVQLVTGSTGLDAYEWGVTLFGINLEVIKDVVYTMRFDRASALYGEFGDFYVGELTWVQDLF